MSIPQWLTEVIPELRRSLPALLGAVALLLAGWLLARLLRALSARLVGRSLGKVERRWGLHHAVADTDARSMLSRVVSTFVFWLVLLFFIAAALESLGLEVVSSVVNRLAYYLPNVLGAVVVLVGGAVLAKVIRGLATTAAKSAGIVRAEEVGRVARAAVLLVASIVALDQIGVDAQLLVILLAVVVGAGVGGASLAFGLGARTSVSNIIASYYLNQTYRVGQKIRVGDIVGTIVRTTPTGVLLDTADGQALIPARRFSDEVSVLIAGGS